MASRPCVRRLRRRRNDGATHFFEVLVALLNVDETTYRGSSLGRRRRNNEKFPLFVFEIAMALRHFRLRCEIFPRGGAGMYFVAGALAVLSGLFYAANHHEIGSLGV